MDDPHDQVKTRVKIPLPRGGEWATVTVSQDPTSKEVTIRCRYPCVEEEFRWTSQENGSYCAPPPKAKFPDEDSIVSFLQEVFEQWNEVEFPYPNPKVPYQRPVLEVILVKGESVLEAIGLNIELLPKYPEIYAIFKMKGITLLEKEEEPVNTSDEAPIIEENLITFKRTFQFSTESDSFTNMLFLPSPIVTVTCEKDPISEEVLILCEHPKYQDPLRWKSGYGRWFKGYYNPARLWSSLTETAKSKGMVIENYSFTGIRLRINQGLWPPYYFTNQEGLPKDTEDYKTLRVQLLYVGETLLTFQRKPSREKLIKCTHPDYPLGFQWSSNSAKGDFSAFWENFEKVVSEFLEDSSCCYCSSYFVPVGALKSTTKLCLTISKKYLDTWEYCFELLRKNG